MTDDDTLITCDNTHLLQVKLDVDARSRPREPRPSVQSVAVVRREAEVKAYVAAATAEKTRRAYRADVDDFLAFGGSIPAPPELVADYLAFRAASSSISTITRRLVGIGRAHTTQGLDDPCKTDLVRTVLRGIRRTHGSAQRAHLR